MALPNWLKFIISLLLPQVVGGIGALATMDSIGTWYKGLKKPPFNPPNWIFGPMWTLLYIMMGIACYLIWASDGSGDDSGEKRHAALKKRLLSLYFVQLTLNAMWSPAFFLLRSPILGLVVIVPLWVLIFVCVVQFRSISLWASCLMVPYLLWVSFATVLNLSIWWLNR